MSIILADYRALVEVTPEMGKLRVCSNDEAYGGEAFMSDSGVHLLAISEHAWLDCPTCKGTGLNPDQSKWWETLANAQYNKLGEWITFQWANNHYDFGIEIFSDAPLESFIDGRHFIHRPSGDNRPWAEVLKDLVSDSLSHGLSKIQMGIMFDNFAGSEGTENIKARKEVIEQIGISFALATKETAPVFKSFGIKTLET